MIGNHDMPRVPMEKEDRSGILQYAGFQKWLFENMRKNGMIAEGYAQGPDGAYAIRMGSVEIIGLQAVTDQRIRPTDLLPGEWIQPEEWKDGTWIEITVGEEEVELVTRSVKKGRNMREGTIASLQFGKR